MDQTVNTGDHFSEGTEGHELNDADVGNIADVIGSHENIPGILGLVLDAETDLALFSVEGNDIDIEMIANGNDLRGMLNAAPAQLGNMNHTVNTADVDEHTVGGHGLDNAVIVLAHFDFRPNGSLSSLTGFVGDGLDGTDNAAAGTVDLSDAELHLLLEQLAQIGILGQTALRSGNEHTNALNGDDDAALVLLGDDAFENRFVLNGAFNVFPKLDSVKALFGKSGIAFHIVDADDISFDLIADLDDILGLDVGVVAQLRNRDITGLLAAHVNLNFRCADRGNDAGHLISCI